MELVTWSDFLLYALRCLPQIVLVLLRVWFVRTMCLGMISLLCNLVVRYGESNISMVESEQALLAHRILPSQEGLSYKLGWAMGKILGHGYISLRESCPKRNMIRFKRKSHLRSIRVYEARNEAQNESAKILV